MTKIFVLKALAVFLSTGVFCLCAHSEVFQVTTTADSGPGSLRDAITNATAAGSGTIVFSNVSGTINLQSALPDISGTLAILGNGPANLAINSYRTNRVFNVLAGAICNISGLTVQGSGPTISGVPPGSVIASVAIVNAGTMSVSNCFLHDHGSGDIGGYGGGAISSSGSSLVLNKVVLSNNVASFAAALSANNVRATNCLFTKNSEKDGAPISVGNSVFSDTTFTGNSAYFTGEGGGIRAGGDLTLLNCNVISNYGDLSSGGIYFKGNNLTISNCAINNNTSSRTGGIYATGTNIVILNSSISGNYASDNCGGIVMGTNGYLYGCTISSNWTGFGSAAGIQAAGTVSMTNCTISGNSTTFHAGPGVLCDSRGNHNVVQAVNCTIAFNGYGVNTTDYGPGTFYALNTLIANNGSGPTNGDFAGTFNSQGYNLIGNLNTNMTIVGSTNGDIYGLDPLLGPLRNNGGPTLTHALMKGSPAIDAGTNAGAPLTDQRGVARPYGTNVDIGAFESEYNVLRFTDVSPLNSTNIHLQVEGLPGSIWTIQASSNFLHWQNVFTSSNGVTGVLEFVDQDAANHPNRFYRAFIDN